MHESLSTAPNLNNRSGFRLVAACVLVALAASFAFGSIPHDDAPYQDWDLAAYREMANAAPSLAPNVSRHFAYRVLGPWLAGLVPLPAPLAFRILTTASLIAVAAALAVFLRRRGVGPVTAFVGVVAFVCNKHMYGYPAWNPFQIGDALSMLALVILWEAMLVKRWLLFGIVFFLGMLARESVLLMVPTALVYCAGSRPASGSTPRAVSAELLRFAAATAPGVLAFILLRFFLPVTGDTTLLDAFVRHAPKLTRIETWLRLLVNVPSPLTFFPVIFWATTWRFFRERPYAALYLVMVFASTLLGSNNERLMGPAFVVFYWLIGVILETHTARRPLLTWGLLPVLFLSSMDHLYARVPLPSVTHTMWVTGVTLAAATALAVIASRAGVGPRSPSYGSSSGPTGSR